MINILAVDDEKDILEIIKKALEREGYIVTTVSDPTRVMEKNLSKFQLIILDVMMPEMDGFSLCREIRNKADCPILFLTAKTEESDLMKGLGIGGDDYITKPFGIGELRARVAAHLRRENREKRNVIFAGDLQFDLQAKKIFYGEEEIPLTKSEYAICEYLVMNRCQIFSKDRIYEHVFGFEGESDLSVIPEHIKNIRAKFQKKGLSVIKTKWGIGYRWE